MSLAGIDPALLDRILSGKSPDQLQLEIDRVNCEEDLATFFKEAWPSFDPSNFQGNWHLDAIADHLMAVTDGQIRRLLINVPYRSSKPVAHDSLVLTFNKGFVRLDQIQIGDSVWTHRSRWRPVTGVYRQGLLPVVRMITRRRRELIAEATHPLLTTAGWEEIGALRKDDVVGLPPCYVECGAQTIPEHEARLLGYLVGDGSCHGTPNITSADDASAADIIRCIEAMGWHANEQTYRMANTGYMLRRITVRAAAAGQPWRKGNRKQLGPVKVWLERHGLREKNSYNKFVPAAVMCGSNEIVRAFLGSYWSCDGYITPVKIKDRTVDRDYVQIHCSSVNIRFMQEVQLLLWRLGINANLWTKVRKGHKTARQGEDYTSYGLTLVSQDDAWRFAQLIDITHERSKRLIGKDLRRFDFDRPMWGDSVLSVEDAGTTECICLSVEDDQSFTANGFAVHNSSLVTVCYPLWTWAQRRKGPRSGPAASFMVLTYASLLAEELATKRRRLLDSPWFQARWGERVRINPKQDTREHLQTMDGGSLYNLGFDGAVTGRGAIIRIIDDPHKPSHVESELVLDSAIRTYNEVITSRFTDPKESAEVIIMQRLGEHDLSGHVIAQEDPGLTHLMIPAEYDPARHCVTVLGWEDPRGCYPKGHPRAGERMDDIDRRKMDGRLFWPSRFTRDWTEKEKVKLGPYATAHQLNQAVSPRVGGVIDPDWWQVWDMEKPFPDFVFVLGSHDPAASLKEISSFRASTYWGVFIDDNNYPQIMLIDKWERRCTFAEQVQDNMDICRKRKVDVFLIENTSNGASVDQEMTRMIAEKGDSNMSCLLITPEKDKLSRLLGVQHMFSGWPYKLEVKQADGTTRQVQKYQPGVIWAPNTDWAQLVIDACQNFPRTKHPDLVDTVTQAIRWLRDNSHAILASEKDATDHAQSLFRPMPEALYDV